MAFVVYLENEDYGGVRSYGPFAIPAGTLQFILRGLNNKGINITYGPENPKYISDLDRLKTAILRSGAVLIDKETLPDGSSREYIHLVKGYKIRSELQHWIV